MEILIISESLFKENSPVGTNVDLEDWKPYILIVQKMYLRKILGPGLLAELQTQIALAAVTPSPNPICVNNRALLIEIAPALAFYTIYQGLPFQWAKIQNKGITALESENSKALDYTDIAKLQRKTLEDAESLAHDLIKYLCDCSAQYPLWAPAPGYGCADRGLTCGEGGARYGKPYDSGIFTPKKRRPCQY
jgi:hypothetical protein